jgi:hypothetical protein
LALPAAAEERGNKKAPSLSLPSFGELPAAEGLSASGPRSGTPALKGSPAPAQYAVSSVEHARGYVRKVSGTRAVALLDSIALSGNPLKSERFYTLVKLTCSQKSAARIEVEVVDSVGNVAMTSTGNLAFIRGKPEAEYLVEWAQTPFRSGGEYWVKVRVAGTELGSWPLRIEEQGPARRG